MTTPLSIPSFQQSQPYEESEEVINRLSNIAELGIITSVARHVLLRDLMVVGRDSLKFNEIVAQEDTEYHKRSYV